MLEIAILRITISSIFYWSIWKQCSFSKTTTHRLVKLLVSKGSRTCSEPLPCNWPSSQTSGCLKVIISQKDFKTQQGPLPHNQRPFLQVKYPKAISKSEKLGQWFSQVHTVWKIGTFIWKRPGFGFLVHYLKTLWPSIIYFFHFQFFSHEFEMPSLTQ